MARAWKLVVSVAFAFACLRGVANAQVVKLADLEARALSERPEVAASAARVRRADADIAAAESTYWPVLSASIDGSLAPGRKLIRYPIDGKDYLIAATQTLDEPSAFRPQPRYGASVSARGTLYDFGRTRSALETARAKAGASEADASARTQVIVLEVRAAYLRWSVAQALWELAKQAETDAKARADRIAGLIAEGAAPPSAATAASAQANAATSESERAELELETARLELGFVSARDLGPDSLPDPMLLAGSSPPSAANPGPAVGPAALGAGGAGAAGAVRAGSATVGPIAVRPGQPAGPTLPVGNAAVLAAKAAQPTAAGGPVDSPSGGPPPPAAGTPTAAPRIGVAAGPPAQPTTNRTAEPASDPLQPSAAGTNTDTNLQLEALEKAREAAEATRRMQSRMSAPTLGYRLNAGIEAQDTSFFPIYGVGIGLTVPLWDGGATSAAEAGARAAEAELTAQLEAERARDKHAKARRNLQMQHAEKLVVLAERSLALAETRAQQLREGPTLGAADQEALAGADAERTRAHAELVRARAARVQLQLGL